MLFLVGVVLVAAQGPETFFKLYGKTTRCFLIDEPVGTLVHAHYRLVSAGVTANRAKPFAPQLVYRLTFPRESMQAAAENSIDLDGVVMFSTKTTGTHSLCFHVDNAPRYDTESRLYMNLEIGVDAIDLDNVAEAKQLDALGRQLQKEIEIVEELQREITYQGSRHEEFSQVTQSTINRVKLFFVFDILLFAILAFIVYRNLRGFFRHIKVV